jgi:hypothetical protein
MPSSMAALGQTVGTSVAEGFGKQAKRTDWYRRHLRPDITSALAWARRIPQWLERPAASAARVGVCYALALRVSFSFVSPGRVLYRLGGGVKFCLGLANDGRASKNIRRISSPTT